MSVEVINSASRWQIGLQPYLCNQVSTRRICLFFFRQGFCAGLEMNMRVQSQWPPGLQQGLLVRRQELRLLNIDRLHALASAHEILRPPLTTALTDLSANLTQLYRVMTSSRLARCGVDLAITEPILLDAQRCWRALIVSELMTNASRHAFVSQEGGISVAVKTASGQVIDRKSVV